MKRRLAALLLALTLLAACPLASFAEMARGGTRYVSSECGLSFMVPDGWNEAPLSKERQVLDAKFVPDGSSPSMFFFSCVDFWEEMGSQGRAVMERSGITRATLDNSAFSAAEIASAYGLKTSDIRTETYAGQEYYVAEVASSTDVLGMTFNVTATFYICARNGYLIAFQFLSTEGYDIPEPLRRELLNSVVW